MFINLHCHTNYSHDCISKIKELVRFAKENNQSALAITDHGNMNGAVEFYEECNKAGIKPIIGSELYICNHGKLASEKTSENRSVNHLVVLAKNYQGYQNLLKLTMLANQNFYYYPRVDEEMLFAHSEGLVVVNGHIGTSLYDCLFFNFEAASACDSIECAIQYLYPDHEERFLEVANRYRNVFGDDFYVEIQLFDRGDIGQQAIGYTLYGLANKHGFKSVGTGDAHYIEPKDAKFHKTFCAIKYNMKVAELADIGYFTSGKYGVVTNELAEECYPPDLINSTNEIADKIEIFNILKPHAIPKFDIDNKKEYIYNLCVDKLRELGKDNEEYLSRVDYELSILELGDLYNYFLIVADYIGWAKSQDILVGPGRGSGASSLIGYLMGITGLDPIQYNLLFDRFYSKDRAINKILPDYDCDFPASRRDEVIEYIRNKYGADKVAGVVTFSTLQGKNALKDVLRTYSACSFSEMNKITELIPSRDKISDKLAEFKEQTNSDSIIYYCLVNEPDLLMDWCHINDGKLTGAYAEYFELAIGLEGAIKSESKHASAIIITSNPICEAAPLIRDKSSDELIVGYDMNSFEKVSLVKFDVLGVKTLDCLMEVNNILEEIGMC